MKKLTRNQAIGVAIGIAVTAFLLFGNYILNLFMSPSTTVTTTEPMATTTGVVIQDEVVGTGATAEPGDMVTVNYVGTLTDGKVFDSSIDRNQTFSFQLGAGQVIRGWDEGLVGMKVGGKRKLTISPDYGYGNQAVGPIPANSTLIFEVDLIDVTKGSATTTIVQ